MTQTATPTFETGSHYITIGWQNGFQVVEKEEVHFYCDTVWRGTPACVTISADRYLHSSGMSEWRLYVSDARGCSGSEDDPIIVDLSNTARRRLGEQCIPIARKWLASDIYSTSRLSAFSDALTRMARDLSSRHDSTTKLRNALTAFCSELSGKTYNRLIRAADAYDTFTTILNNEEEDVTCPHNTIGPNCPDCNPQ